MSGPRPFVPPLIGTPRDETFPTRGGEVADVARRLGTPLMPHQQLVMDVALEYDPANGDQLRYDDVTWTIMRQSGKTTGVRAKKVWRCSVVPHRLGFQTCLYTAQTRGAARKKLERDFAGGLRSAEDAGGSFREITNVKGRPSRSTRQWKLSLNNGQENILFGRGNWLQIDAPNREAGHGDSLDDADVDEAWAHQTDAVEQAARPAMQTRIDAQLWRESTAGDERSFYLWPHVRDGRRSVADGSGPAARSCYFEWALPAEAAIDDEDAWWEYMPALGRTVRIEYLRGELERMRRSPDPDAEDLFRRGYCNQWVRVPVLPDEEQPEIVSEPIWLLRRVSKETPIVGEIALGVDVSSDGRSASIAVAGRNASGRVQVEVAFFDPGTFWLEERLAATVERHAVVAVAYDAGGPARVMAPEIARAAAGVTIVRLSGREWQAACEGFVTAIDDNRACHVDQPWLDGSLEGARKKLRGDGWLWDRLTALADIAPLCAVTAAHRAVELLPEPPPPAPGPLIAVT